MTQYECNNEMAGPPGCLQYYTGTSGNTASFNFPTSTTTLLATGTTVANRNIQIDSTKYVASLSLPSNIFSATHLSNQNYDICFRRESGYCAICFIPSITFGAAAATAATISAFGLSNQAADVKAETGTACISDYLIVSIFLIVFHGKTYIDGVLLQIRQAVGTAAIAIKQNEAIAGVDRLCGRFLSTTDDATFATYVAATNSVCSK